MHSVSESTKYPFETSVGQLLIFWFVSDLESGQHIADNHRDILTTDSESLTISAVINFVMHASLTSS